MLAPCASTRTHSSSAAWRALPSKMNCAAPAGNLSPSSFVKVEVGIWLGVPKNSHRFQDPLRSEPWRKRKGQPRQPLFISRPFLRSNCAIGHRCHQIAFPAKKHTALSPSQGTEATFNGNLARTNPGDFPSQANPSSFIHHVRAQMLP